jgi:lauroyl/myristoyl acyltransferase
MRLRRFYKSSPRLRQWIRRRKGQARYWLARLALAALRRDLPAVPVFARRRPDGGHRLTVQQPIYPPHSGDRDQDVLRLTQTFSTILEDRIRHNPAEWVWWHRRWRRPPVPQLDLDREIQYSRSNSVLF